MNMFGVFGLPNKIQMCTRIRMVHSNNIFMT